MDKVHTFTVNLYKEDGVPSAFVYEASIMVDGEEWVWACTTRSGISAKQLFDLTIEAFQRARERGNA